MGKSLADVLVTSFDNDNGLNIDKFHIVSHSLGAQMAGEIGRAVLKKSNKTHKIRR